MDIREKITDPEEPLRAMVDDIKAGLHTALTGIVTKFDPAKMTVDVQPSIKSAVRQPDGTVKMIPYPLLTGVPVNFPGGGGATLTFPIKPGDEAMVTFSSRSTDAWMQSGGEQNPMDARTQDLSDGIAHVGVRSSSKVPPNVSADSTEIRTDDGKTKISMNGGGGLTLDTDKAVGIKAANGVSMDGGAGNVTMKGTLIVEGDVIANGVSLVHHVHDKVQPGGGNTGEPVK